MASAHIADISQTCSDYERARFEGQLREQQQTRDPYYTRQSLMTTPTHPKDEPNKLLLLEDIL